MLNPIETAIGNPPAGSPVGDAAHQRRPQVSRLIRFARLLGLSTLLLATGSAAAAQSLNASAPASPVRLIFIHHSTGEN